MLTVMICEMIYCNIIVMRTRFNVLLIYYDKTMCFTARIRRMLKNELYSSQRITITSLSIHANDKSGLNYINSCFSVLCVITNVGFYIYFVHLILYFVL